MPALHHYFFFNIISKPSPDTLNFDVLQPHVNKILWSHNHKKEYVFCTFQSLYVMTAVSLINGHQRPKKPACSILNVEPEFRTPQFGHSQKFQVLHDVAIRIVPFIRSDSYAAFVLYAYMMLFACFITNHFLRFVFCSWNITLTPSHSLIFQHFPLHFGFWFAPVSTGYWLPSAKLFRLERQIQAALIFNVFGLTSCCFLLVPVFKY